MAARILDPLLEEQLIAERRRTGGDRYDEVWEGEYVMSPLANNEHQALASSLAAIFKEVLGNQKGVWCLAGANVSNQEVNWTKNYRCPDVVVVLPGSRAQNRHTHWYGGPDLVVEIVSEGDASYEKLDFYGNIGVQEALIIDRDPWSLHLYRQDPAGGMCEVARTDLGGAAITLQSLDCQLSLFQRGSQPAIRVAHAASNGTWET